MRRILAVAFKEIMGFFFTPLVYVLWAIFLFLNSWAFAQIIAVLNSPEGAISMYPVEIFFGGTIYFWFNLFVLIPLLTMKAISEERKVGSLEHMLTAPLSEGEFVLGKFLAIMFVLKVFWLSSCVYPMMLQEQIPIHLPAVIVAFFGTMLVCGVFSALGIAVSSISPYPLLSAFLCFVLIIVLFTIGVFSRFLVGKISDILNAVSLLERFQPFGSGTLDLASVVYFISLIWVFLEFATYWLKLRVKQQRSFRLFLILFILIGINIFVMSHNKHWNFSSERFSEISERTRLFLQQLNKDVDVYVCLSQDLRVYGWMKGLLKNCQDVSERLRVHWVDPIKDYQKMQSLMRDYGINPTDTIIVKSGEKFRIIRQRELVEMDYSNMMRGLPPKVVGFSGESRFLAALIYVTQKKRIVLRWITGHGEFLPNREIRGRSFSLLASTFNNQGMEILVSPILSRANIESNGVINADKLREKTKVKLKDKEVKGYKKDIDEKESEVFVIVSPISGFLDEERRFLTEFVEQGGRIFWLLDVGTPSDIRNYLKETFFVEVGDDIVVDPVSNVNTPINLFISFYGNHPITSPIIGRAMLLLQACSVRKAEGKEKKNLKVYPLLFTSQYAWADKDWRSNLLKYDPDKDLAGQIPLAVSVEFGSGRMVVVGDADFASDTALDRVENRTFVLSAMDWLVGEESKIGLPPKEIKTIQLTLSANQMRYLILMSMFGFPLSILGFGIIVWSWRKRR